MQGIGVSDTTKIPFCRIMQGGEQVRPGWAAEGAWPGTGSLPHTHGALVCVDGGGY